MRRSAASVPATRPRGGISIASIVALLAFALAWLIVALLRGVPAWVGGLYGGASVLAFVLYAVDKSAAVGGRQRIPESMLLGAVYIGGWPGAVVAQQVLRHKTIKWSFRVRFWVGVAANVAAFAWLTTTGVHGPS